MSPGRGRGGRDSWRTSLGGRPPADICRRLVNNILTFRNFATETGTYDANSIESRSWPVRIATPTRPSDGVRASILDPIELSLVPARSRLAVADGILDDPSAIQPAIAGRSREDDGCGACSARSLASSLSPRRLAGVRCRAALPGPGQGRAGLARKTSRFIADGQGWSVLSTLATASAVAARRSQGRFRLAGRVARQLMAGRKREAWNDEDVALLRELAPGEIDITGIARRL
ncbi:MAG: hypothetical protein JWN66_2840 [Sphingomonas bacterium]|nr:hypothetical protein [Sphingomonas bacterium]